MYLIPKIHSVFLWQKSHWFMYKIQFWSNFELRYSWILAPKLIEILEHFEFSRQKNPATLSLNHFNHMIFCAKNSSKSIIFFRKIWMFVPKVHAKTILQVRDVKIHPNGCRILWTLKNEPTRPTRANYAMIQQSRSSTIFQSCVRSKSLKHFKFSPDFQEEETMTTKIRL